MKHLCSSEGFGKSRINIENIKKPILVQHNPDWDPNSVQGIVGADMDGFYESTRNILLGVDFGMSLG